MLSLEENCDLEVLEGNFLLDSLMQPRLFIYFFFLTIKVSFRSWGDSSVGSLPGKCGDLNLVPRYACWYNCNSSSREMGSRDKENPWSCTSTVKVQASEALSQKDRRHQRTNIRDCPLTSMHQDTYMHPLQMNTHTIFF